MLTYLWIIFASMLTMLVIVCISVDAETKKDDFFFGWAFRILSVLGLLTFGLDFWGTFEGIFALVVCAIFCVYCARIDYVHNKELREQLRTQTTSKT